MNLLLILFGVLLVFVLSVYADDIREKLELAKAKVLRRLLLDVQRNNYRWHDLVLPVIRGTVSFWAPEVVVTRQVGSDFEIYLAKYKGGIPSLEGTWNIPGAHHRNGRSIAQECNRVSRDQLGCEVDIVDIVETRLWEKGKEHEQGYPLSLYVLCVPKGPVRLDEDHAFFSLDQLPRGLNPVHREFAEKLLGHGSIDRFLEQRFKSAVQMVHSHPQNRAA